MFSLTRVPKSFLSFLLSRICTCKKAFFVLIIVFSIVILTMWEWLRTCFGLRKNSSEDDKSSERRLSEKRKLLGGSESSPDNAGVSTERAEDITRLLSGVEDLAQSKEGVKIEETVPAVGVEVNDISEREYVENDLEPEKRSMPDESVDGQRKSFFEGFDSLRHIDSQLSIVTEEIQKSTHTEIGGETVPRKQFATNYEKNKVPLILQSSPEPTLASNKKAEFDQETTANQNGIEKINFGTSPPILSSFTDIPVLSKYGRIESPGLPLKTKSSDDSQIHSNKQDIGGSSEKHDSKAKALALGSSNEFLKSEIAKTVENLDLIEKTQVKHTTEINENYYEAKTDDDWVDLTLEADLINADTNSDLNLEEHPVLERKNKDENFTLAAEKEKDYESKSKGTNDEIISDVISDVENRSKHKDLIVKEEETPKSSIEGDNELLEDVVPYVENINEPNVLTAEIGKKPEPHIQESVFYEEKGKNEPKSFLAETGPKQDPTNEVHSDSIKNLVSQTGLKSVDVYKEAALIEKAEANAKSDNKESSPDLIEDQNIGRNEDSTSFAESELKLENENIKPDVVVDAENKGEHTNKNVETEEKHETKIQEVYSESVADVVSAARTKDESNKFIEGIKVGPELTTEDVHSDSITKVVSDTEYEGQAPNSISETGLQAGDEHKQPDLLEETEVYSKTDNEENALVSMEGQETVLGEDPVSSPESANENKEAVLNRKTDLHEETEIDPKTDNKVGAFVLKVHPKTILGEDPVSILESSANGNKKADLLEEKAPKTTNKEDALVSMESQETVLGEVRISSPESANENKEAVLNKKTDLHEETEIDPKTDNKVGAFVLKVHLKTVLGEDPVSIPESANENIKSDLLEEKAPKSTNKEDALVLMEVQKAVLDRDPVSSPESANENKKAELHEETVIDPETDNKEDVLNFKEDAETVLDKVPVPITESELESADENKKLGETDVEDHRQISADHYSTTREELTFKVDNQVNDIPCENTAIDVKIPYIPGELSEDEDKLRQSLITQYISKYIHSIEDQDISCLDNFQLDIRTKVGVEVRQIFGTVQDLFSTSSSNNRILIYGKPGFGKTFLCRSLSLIWAIKNSQVSTATLNDHSIIHESSSSSLDNQAPEDQEHVEFQGRSSPEMKDYNQCLTPSEKRQGLLQILNISSVDVSKFSFCILFNLEEYSSRSETVYEDFVSAYEYYIENQTFFNHSLFLFDGYEHLNDEGKKSLVQVIDRIPSTGTVIVTASPEIDQTFPKLFCTQSDICGLRTLSLSGEFEEESISKINALEGVSPLIAELIFQVLNQNKKPSFFELLGNILYMLIRKNGSAVQDEDIEDLFQEVGRLFLRARRNRNYAIGEEDLRSNNLKKYEQEIVQLINLGIFLCLNVEDKVVFVIAHKPFMEFFLVKYLSHEWQKLESDDKRNAFFNRIVCFEDCSEEYVLNPETDKLYRVGVLPDIVLEQSTGKELSTSVFRMRADVDSEYLDFAFSASNLLFRIDEKRLAEFGFDKLKDSPEMQEMFKDFVGLFEFENCTLSVSYYHDVINENIIMKFLITDESSGKVILFGVVSLTADVQPTEYNEIHFECINSGLGQTYLFLREAMEFLKLSHLAEEFVEDHYADLVYKLVLSAVACSEERHTQVSQGSTSVSNPQRITWEILSVENSTPKISCVSTFSPPNILDVDMFKSKADDHINTIKQFCDSADNSSLTIRIRRQFKPK